MGRGEALRLLGLPAHATEAEVRAAFRRKVIESHPDTAMDGTDDSMVRRLIEAYHLLVDPTSRAAPDPPVRRVSERQSGVRPVDVSKARAEGYQPSMGARRQCSQCQGSGRDLRVVTCPACHGDSVVTTLDIRRVRVFRCSTCAGRGRMQSWVQCDACGGTGEE